MKYYLGMRLQSWDNLIVHGLTITQMIHNDTSYVAGASGFVLAFDDYEAALQFVDGNAARVVEIVKVEANL